MRLRSPEARGLVPGEIASLELDYLLEGAFARSEAQRSEKVITITVPLS